eukprot:192694_1
MGLSGSKKKGHTVKQENKQIKKDNITTTPTSVTKTKNNINKINRSQKENKQSKLKPTEQPSIRTENAKVYVLLVIDGFIRDIGVILDNNYVINKIIPKSLNQIIFNYYYVCSIYILYHFQSIDGLKDNKYGLTMYDIEEKKLYKCKIYNIKNHSKIRNPAFVGDTAIHLAKNISLPSKLNTILKPLYKNSTYNVLFKCGGTVGSSQSFQSDAIIFDPLQYRNGNTFDLRAYHWTLPSLPVHTKLVSEDSPSTNIIYSDIYGLLCFGETDIFSLSLEDNDIIISKGWGSNIDSKWKWKYFYKMDNANVCRRACILLNKHQIFCCGGEKPHKYRYRPKKYPYAGILNLKTKEWIKLEDFNYPRSCLGMYWDENFDRVYIGGGDSDYVDYYDLNKQKWIALRHATTRYGNWPILWTSNQDQNVLNIAGTNPLSMEYLDLREQIWTSVTKNEIVAIFGSKNQGLYYNSFNNNRNRWFAC